MIAQLDRIPAVVRSLEESPCAHLCVSSRVRPLWSLSVEDPLQWRRLSSATSAGLIPACFLKCADCSSGCKTWRPSSPGYRKQTTCFPLASVTNSLSLAANASPRSPDASHTHVTTDPGTPLSGVPMHGLR